MNFNKIRRCTCGGTLNLSKSPTDPRLREEIADIIYETPGVVYEYLYHVGCKHDKIGIGSSGRTLEEAVEKWNTGKTCEEMWTKEEIEQGKANR